MSNCAWCGKEIGPGKNNNREPESCGERECDREVRDMYAQMESEKRERADGIRTMLTKRMEGQGCHSMHYWFVRTVLGHRCIQCARAAERGETK